MKKNVFLFSLYRWHEDSFCSGSYPQSFENIERTLRNHRKTKYGKSPNTLEDIEREFKNENVFRDLGLSKFHEHGVLYNGIKIEKDYCNCFFSSEKSIKLVKENLEPNERFFIMDATFRITPHGEFQQVLIIHVQFGIKVSVFHMNERTKRIFQL